MPLAGPGAWRLPRAGIVCVYGGAFFISNQVVFLRQRRQIFVATDTTMCWRCSAPEDIAVRCTYRHYGTRFGYKYYGALHLHARLRLVRATLAVAPNLPLHLVKTLNAV